MIMMRPPCRGSPSLRSSIMSEARLSERMFLVWTARREISSSGAPSAAVATFTSEEYGSPEPGIRVASAPERPSRRSFLAAVLGLKSDVGSMGAPPAGPANARRMTDELFRSVSGLTKIGNTPGQRRGKLKHGTAARRGLYGGKSFAESRV